MKAKENELSNKEKLLQAGLSLFAEYGYDATTTRMIAKKAEVTRSSIAFYFETKEAYYNAVMQRTLEIVRNFYEPMFTTITNAYEKNEITPENAYCNIFRLLKLQITWFNDEQYEDIVRLIMKEQSSVGHADVFYDTLVEKFIDMLTQLIMTATGIQDRQKALLLSLSINGMVQSMCEHKNFTNRLLELNCDKKQLEKFREDLINMTLDNARMLLNGNLLNQEELC